MWENQFKIWGIYDQDYHKKYRHHLYNKRYETYIDLVIGDIKDNIKLKGDFDPFD